MCCSGVERSEYNEGPSDAFWPKYSTKPGSVHSISTLGRQVGRNFAKKLIPSARLDLLVGFLSFLEVTTIAL